MKTSTLPGALLFLALLVTACAPAATSAPTNTVQPTEPQMTASPVATESPAATGSPAATESATEAPTGVPITGQATVNMGESTGMGPILVDGNGFALYVFMGDTQNGGTSTCMDDCATEWPPLISEDAPAAGSGVDASLLGTITREDGTLQVTYNGWPLYLFHEDMTAGDTNGQGVEDEFGQWFLVSPAGAPIQQ